VSSTTNHTTPITICINKFTRVCVFIPSLNQLDKNLSTHLIRHAIKRAIINSFRLSISSLLLNYLFIDLRMHRADSEKSSHISRIRRVCCGIISRPGEFRPSAAGFESWQIYLMRLAPRTDWYWENEKAPKTDSSKPLINQSLLLPPFLMRDRQLNWSSVCDLNYILVAK